MNCIRVLGLVAVLLAAGCQTPPSQRGATAPVASGGGPGASAEGGAPVSPSVAGQGATPPTVAPAPAPPVVAAPAVPDTSRAVLAEGLALYRKGSYNLAAQKLGEVTELQTAPLEVRLEALKFSAFSQCAMNRRTICGQTFDRLLAIEPRFELQSAEARHPIWGPIFLRSKQARQKMSPGR